MAVPNTFGIKSTQAVEGASVKVAGVVVSALAVGVAFCGAGYTVGLPRGRLVVICAPTAAEAPSFMDAAVVFLETSRVQPMHVQVRRAVDETDGWQVWIELVTVLAQLKRQD